MRNVLCHKCSSHVVTPDSTTGWYLYMGQWQVKLSLIIVVKRIVMSSIDSCRGVESRIQEISLFIK
jgi:hypothetical protein